MMSWIWSDLSHWVIRLGWLRQTWSPSKEDLPTNSRKYRQLPAICSFRVCLSSRETLNPRLYHSQCPYLVTERDKGDKAWLLQPVAGHPNDTTCCRAPNQVSPGLGGLRGSLTSSSAQSCFLPLRFTNTIFFNYLFYLFIYLFVYLFIYLLVYLFIYLLIYLAVPALSCGMQDLHCGTWDL